MLKYILICEVIILSKSYFIKERLIALGAKFDVFDENGKEIYLVEADKFDIGKNINVYTPNKDERVLYMEQKIRIGAHKYVMYNVSGKEIALIEKEFMIPKYNISGIYGDIEMESENILGRSYTIRKNDLDIGYIEKEFNLLGRDKYNLKVIDEEYTLFLIGLLIMIDMIKFHGN